MSNLVAKNKLIQLYLSERSKTENLCHPLTTEDYVIQSIDDVSPPKWHLAHTTWFFERFVLIPYLKKYSIYDELFQYLFNSYYHQIGQPFPRIRRGSLSRPTVKTIYSYRKHIDKYIPDLIEKTDVNFQQIESLITLGLHHEQQHQELLLMDIKHIFSIQLNYPVYQLTLAKFEKNKVPQNKWLAVNADLVEIGHEGEHFCFDNELPRHKVCLKPFTIASRLVTNEEYCEFIEAGGYQDAKWWLSDAWDFLQKNNWQAPLYWEKNNNTWMIFTLNGLKEMNPAEPVVHVSYYEADAFARWKGCRLPTEAEWEYFVYSKNLPRDEGNFLETNRFHPQITYAEHTPAQFFGDVWEWTASPYCPYPGYKPLDGVLGEYNGKFMSNQFVLRGGSCVTPASHIRLSYRNFFQPDKRWQFSGIRLVKENA